jgi:hypothetical protein
MGDAPGAFIEGLSCVDVIFIDVKILSRILERLLKLEILVPVFPLDCYLEKDRLRIIAPGGRRQEAPVGGPKTK